MNPAARYALPYAAFLLLLISSATLRADHSCSSPLVLDLGGDGIIDTTGLEQLVEFDSNGDGHFECITWAEDGILWLDRNRNHRVDGGHELFGNSTILSAGGHAEQGFEALAEFDAEAQGGNGDGLITPEDAIWPLLAIWVDRNLNVRLEKDERHTLNALNILALDLAYTESDEIDGNANKLPFQGRYLKRVPSPLGGKTERWLKMVDVFFLAVNSCGTPRH